MTDHAPMKLEKHYTCWIERRWHIDRPVHRILKRGVQRIASWPLGHGEGEGAGCAKLLHYG